jgi:hypothetical protein
MADLPLVTALGALQIVPCVIAIAQGKDNTTRSLCGALIVIASWLALLPYVNVLRDITNGTFHQILAIAGVALAVVVAIRIKQQTQAALIVTGAVLLALRVLGVLG